jgi:hypothetical protein
MTRPSGRRRAKAIPLFLRLADAPAKLRLSLPGGVWSMAVDPSWKRLGWLKNGEFIFA